MRAGANGRFLQCELMICAVQGEVWFFGLVRIRPFRSDLTISEPWDEGDRFE